MSEQKPSVTTNSARPKFPLPSRILAILLMVMGAAAFVVTLLLWGDRILCLLGSTVITFAGLGFVVAERRLHKGAQEEDASEMADGEKELAGEDRPDKNLAGNGSQEAAVRAAIQPVQIFAKTYSTSPAEPPGNLHPYVIGEPPVLKAELLKQVVNTLQSSGAQVRVETQRSGRALLKITGHNGLIYTAMVHDSLKPVEVSEIRSLQALVTSSDSAGGYLFSTGPFTPQAYDWASARKIRLVMADELNEISL